MNKKHSPKQTALAAMLGLAVGVVAGPYLATSPAREAEPPASHAVAAETTPLEAAPGAILMDGENGMTFQTSQDDGTLTKRMRLTKQGCLLVGQRGPIGGFPGTMELSMNSPSRPGSIVMINQHEAVKGVGDTLAFYASGHGQIFLSSSWLGQKRRTPQIEKGPLPLGYPSPKYPVATSAARFEIGARVNDWVSLAAIFEPIADDGRPFVINDRDHPYMGQVQYLPASGEWINNRRVGRHALLLGTTHTTGATAGGLVLAGDAYHEYSGKGPVIKSPNGTPYRLVVDDDGNLSTERF